ncbi:MAG: NADH-quinone oxidoreductase subunit J [Bacteroidia bacterium]|nr:NADH-quinone oxidoreductase subunit J [Bacteroidia bacterium]
MVFLFYLLTAIMLISALMVVFSRYPINSVIYLIICFLMVAGHYILLNAQFLAVVHIIVYTGAVMVLFLFVLMLLNLNAKIDTHRSVLIRIAAVVSGGLLFLVLVAALKGSLTAPLSGKFDSSIGLVKNLGMVLYKDFMLPFEMSSVLFLSAMVGALMLSKRQ